MRNTRRRFERTMVLPQGNRPAIPSLALRACITIWLAAVITIPGVFGCGRSTGNRNALEPAQCFVLSASTREAIEEIAAAYHEQNGVTVTLSPDDSSRLAQQIVNGAPADLFLSANQKWGDYVRQQGYAADSCPLLGNTLVLVVPPGNPAGIRKPEDLTGSAVKRLAVAGPTVPAGIYARQALTHLHLWDALEKANKVMIGDNVRTTLAYVERGEVDAGIVYSTDARISSGVQTVSVFAPSAHDRIVYPLVLLQTGAQNKAARPFYDHLRSPQAAKVFRKYGFSLEEDK